MTEWKRGDSGLREMVMQRQADYEKGLAECRRICGPFGEHLFESWYSHMSGHFVQCALCGWTDHDPENGNKVLRGEALEKVASPVVTSMEFKCDA